MTYTKFISVGCVAMLLAAAAAAGLPGIDAPTGAGIGTSAAPSAEGKIEGSDPINGSGVGGTEGRPAEGGVSGGRDAPGANVPVPGSGTLKDAIELCERLAGVERELCLQQARENRERALAPGIGATPGRAGAGAGGEEQRQAPPR